MRTPTVTAVRRLASGPGGTTLVGLAALAALTWAADRLRIRATPAATLYLALVVLVALRGLIAPALLAAAVGTVVWDLVFTGPVVTGGERIFRDVVTLLVMSATAVVVSRVTAARRVSEQYWRNLFENSPTIHFVLDSAGTVCSANAVGARQLGYAAGELVGRSVLDVFVAEDRASARDFIAECLAHMGASLRWEGQTVRRDGTGLRVRATGRAIEIAGQRPVILLAGEDVTDRERAEAERRAHVRFLESMDRVNRVIQGTTDLEQMLRDVLDIVLELVGADRAGLVYPCDPDAPAWVVMMARARPGVADVFGERSVVPRTSDGARVLRAARESEVPIQFGPGTGHPLPEVSREHGSQSVLATCIYPKGDAPYFFALAQAARHRVWTPEEERLFQEIGRRLADALTSLTLLRDLRQSEQALRASEARFRIFADQAGDLFFLHDERGAVVDANRQACESLGYTREELIGLTPDQLEADVEQRRYHVVGTARGEGEVIAFETSLRRKDGTELPVEARGRWFTEGGRQLVLSLVRDVTARKRLEADLLQAQKMEAVGRLAGGVAHDFNNLLTVITGYSDFIVATSPPGDERRADAEEIRRAADRAALLTQQLLAFSRKQELRPEVLSVNAVVEEAARLLRRLIGEDVALGLRLAPDAGAARIDAGQLEQVLMNLAVNARDAMPSGGRLTIETGAVVVEREEPAQPAPLAPGCYLRLAVRDTGTGMSPDIHARAFEPFFTTKGVGKGTGLGLSTVYGIVTQSGGRLRVDSVRGRGTTFELFFPRLEATDVGAPASAEPAAPGTETVLLVEDEAMVRRLAEQALERAGYRVLTAAGAGEALRLAAAHDGPINLVVTDVVMPGMPGPALVGRLETARPGLRVLYISGYADDAMARYGVREDRVSFLAKPFSPDDLARRVREVLDARIVGR